MASWSEIEAAEPEFAAAARAFLDAHKHKTVATMRRDGSPRISGTEAWFAGGERNRFRADIAEVATVRLPVPPEHLVIESWAAGRGLRRVER